MGFNSGFKGLMTTTTNPTRNSRLILGHYCQLLVLQVPGYLSRYSDWLRAGRSGDRTTVGGEIFRTCPDLPWGPPSLLYNGYRFFPGGKERPGRDADPSPPSSAVGHERVELYLYPPYGPYGLCRASVPVRGWPLPLPYLYSTVRISQGVNE